MPSPPTVGVSRQYRAPQLTVKWEPRFHAFRTSLAVFLHEPGPIVAGLLPVSGMRVTWIEGKVPRQALVASVLWHLATVLILLLPFWQLLGRERLRLAPVQIELTWYQPANDLPLISPPNKPARPSPPGWPRKPMPPPGANAFHPRQTILSLPKRITHPRQTLIQPEAPPEPPKILPPLPNIVQWSASIPQPTLHLRLNPSGATPRQRKREFLEPPVPQVPNLEKTPSPLSIASSPVINPEPKLPVSPGQAPVASQREVAGAAPPSIAPAFADNGDTSLRHLIAISATPAPPAPKVSVPKGNLSARVTISPEGPRPGVPGGSPNAIAGATGRIGGGLGSLGGTGGSGGTASGPGGGEHGISGPPEISVSSGGPRTTPASGPLGAAGGGSVNLAEASPPPPNPVPMIPLRRRSLTGPMNFDFGTKPEEILGDKQIYTVYINMPNLTSATGSWVLNFAELPEGSGPGSPRRGSPTDLSGPVPLRKVDPKYPPVLMAAHVQGEVVLYAIIRRDGSLDSIQVLRSVDPQLDENAAEALARWKFRPATRDGRPVEVEAVIHIPFRATQPF